VTTKFDRLAPRTPTADLAGSAHHDTEGKRALFSSTAPEVDVPSVGSITVECSRCHEVTALSPMAAARTALPSLVLSIGVGRGDRESTVGIVRRRNGAFLRCPACGRGSWTRLTVRL
jgi:hypothetical protein